MKRKIHATAAVQFQIKKEWTIRQAGKALHISGGADAVYEVELESEEPSFFALPMAWHSFSRDQLSAVDSRVLEELLTAEIAVPLLQKSRYLKVRVLGDAHRLEVRYTSDSAADLLIIVRVGSTYTKLLQKVKYETINTPHLFVDMAYQHTASFGPLVFPGETACIACLQGRISNRWGDEKPPLLPRASSEFSGVISELLQIELSKIAEGDTSLTNKTVSWNFRERLVSNDQLLKVPLCPVCSQNRVDPSGTLVLPWIRDESISNTV